MRNWLKGIIFILGLALVFAAFHTVQAQTGGEERFPNGIVLKGEFLKYYRRVPDRQLLFGNPISNEMDWNGTRVQYFDRARFELVMTTHGPEVQLARLGEFYYDESLTASAAQLPVSPTCRYFSKTQHRVCYSFLQFYDDYNGTVYFGQPVSEMLFVNEQFVQYFEYARMEYRFNSRGDQKIGLTNIGRLSMQNNVGPVPPLTPQIMAQMADLSLLKAHAYVAQALVAPNSANTLYVVAHMVDAEGQQTPAAQAVVRAALIVGSQTTPLALQSTDDDGIVRVDLPPLELAPKQMVQLRVTVEADGQTAAASTWYRIWY